MERESEGSDVKACVLIIEGTNCEQETKRALDLVGISAEIVHLKQFSGRLRKRDIWDYHAIVIPGGFSAGDYVRAGAIFSSYLRTTLGREIESYIEEGRVVLGICNGFQVLVESGLLPGFNPGKLEAALSVNTRAKFECREVTLLHSSKKGRCSIDILIEKDELIRMPIAHMEGRFLAPREVLEELVSNDQVIFKYSDPRGEVKSEYPWNPNGSELNIAGICNPEGNVIGLMPHPERAVLEFQSQEWTRGGGRRDGFKLFYSLKHYLNEV